MSASVRVCLRLIPLFFTLRASSDSEMKRSPAEGLRVAKPSLLHTQKLVIGRRQAQKGLVVPALVRVQLLGPVAVEPAQLPAGQFFQGLAALAEDAAGFLHADGHRLRRTVLAVPVHKVPQIVVKQGPSGVVMVEKHQHVADQVVVQAPSG